MLIFEMVFEVYRYIVCADLKEHVVVLSPILGEASQVLALL